MFDPQSDQSGEIVHNVVREGVERTDALVQTSAEISKRAARASADIVQRNAETVQQALQSSAEVAARLTGRTAEQFGRVLGLSGEEVHKAALQSSEHLDAIVRSSSAFAEAAQTLSREWASFAHDRLEQNFTRFESLLRSRTPQDFALAQADLLRDNLESFLHYAKRVADASVQLGHDTGKQVSAFVDRAKEQTRAA